MNIKLIFTEEIIKKEIENLEKRNLIKLETHVQHDDFSSVFCTTEYYHIKKILAIYNCLSDLALDNPENEKINRDYKTIQKIVNYTNDRHCKFNEYFERDMLYGYPSKEQISRIYPEFSSMTLLTRQIRYYLFKDFYTDVDLVNAHPTILLDFATSNNIDCPSLFLYVNNRDEVFNTLVNQEQEEKSIIKTKILIIFNLVFLNSDTKHNFYISLHKEILNIREGIWNTYMKKNTPLKKYLENNPDFLEKSLNKKKVSAQSIYCFTKESEMVLKLYTKFFSISEEFKTKLSFIPFYDGAYLHFENIDVNSKINQFLDDFNQTITPYIFKVKPIEPNWTYLNMELLNSYENVLDFLSDLSMNEFEVLLKKLKIKDFCLDKKTYQIIESETDPNNICTYSNEELVRHVNMLSRTFLKELHTKILETCVSKVDFYYLREEIKKTIYNRVE